MRENRAKNRDKVGKHLEKEAKMEKGKHLKGKANIKKVLFRPLTGGI